MNPLQLTAFTQDKPAMIADIVALLRLQSRVTNTVEDLLLERYAGEAVGAAENYLMRDVWPTVRTWTGDLPLCPTLLPAYGRVYNNAWEGHSPSAFVVRRGRAVVTLTDSDDQPLDPATYCLLSSADPKTWGFQITPVSDLTAITVNAVLGFATLAAMPDDLQGFILKAAAAGYEIRELANYGAAAQGVETASYIPTYLLDSWANLSYA